MKNVFLTKRLISVFCWILAIVISCSGVSEASGKKPFPDPVPIPVVEQTPEDLYANGQFFIKFSEPAGNPGYYHQMAPQNLFNSTPALQSIAVNYGIASAATRRLFSNLVNSSRPSISGPSARLDNIFLFFSGTSNIAGLIEALRQQPNVVYVEQVPLYKTLGTFTPNDPRYSAQWDLFKVNAGEAWHQYNQRSDKADVIVAIVDDAVRVKHEDLQKNIWINQREYGRTPGVDDDGNGYVDDIYGWDAADNDNDPSPPLTAVTGPFMHGTRVAGVAGALSNNATGLASISNTGEAQVQSAEGGGRVWIMPVKVRHNSNGQFAEMLDAPYAGVEYAMVAGAKVINMSWGGLAGSQTYEDLFMVAHMMGKTLVAAAGNDGSETPCYPAAYPWVISVGATDRQDLKTPTSNFDASVDLMAPGVDIWSSAGSGNSAYAQASGTSSSAAMVSGLCGLLYSTGRYFTPDQVESLIKTSSVNIYPLNAPVLAGKLGAGRIDAARAVSAAIGLVTANPEVDFSSNFQTVVIGEHPVTFEAHVSYGVITEYAWTFEGATTPVSTAANPVVTYDTPGVYSVSLEITLNSGVQLIVQHAGYIKAIEASAFQDRTGRENDHWCFFSQNMLHFNGSAPASIASGGQPLEHYTNVSVSNVDGNLIFYGDPTRLYNRRHVIMQGASYLVGGYNYDQAMAIVPQPARFVNGKNLNHGRYYVFTAHGNVGTDSLRYSIVDMNLDNGLGAIDPAQRNIVLFPGQVQENIVTVPHANGHDLWIIAHLRDGNQFLVYQLTPDGLNTTPVNNNVGWQVSYLYSEFAVSAQGDRLARIVKVAVGLNLIFHVEYFQFNNQTGIITDPVSVMLSTGTLKTGLEFSLSGNFLYHGYQEGGINGIAQIDITRPDPVTQLPYTITNIPLPTANSFILGNMETGPDGRIYVMQRSSMNGFVINNPDALGVACDVQTLPALLAGGAAGAALQNKIPYPVYRVEGVVTSARTGLPLSGVRVIDATGEIAQTDVNGKYVFYKMQGWSGSISLQKAGYVSYMPVGWSGDPYQNLSTNYTGHDYSFMPQNGMVLDGTIYEDVPGQPGINGVTLLTQINAMSTQPVVNGQYDLTVFYDDHVRLQPQHEGFDFDPVFWEWNPVTGSGQKDFKGVRKVFKVSGHVTQEDGVSIIPGASLTVLVDGQEYSPPVTIGPDGYYEFNALYGKAVYVKPVASGWGFPVMAATANPEAELSSMPAQAQVFDFKGVALAPVAVSVSGTVMGVAPGNSYPIQVHLIGSGDFAGIDFHPDATGGTYTTGPVIAPGWIGSISITSSVYNVAPVAPMFPDNQPLMTSFVQDYEVVVPFTDIQANFGSNLQWFGADWGDYDNDGDLDVALVGRDTTAPVAWEGYTRKVYRNNNGTFEDSGIVFDDPFEYGYNQCAWIDYDNDGYLDLAIAFMAETRLYHNEPGVNGQRTLSIDSYISFGTVSTFAHGMDWGDYNNDGYVDVLFAGPPGTDVRIYRNVPNGIGGRMFEYTDTPVYPVSSGAYDVDWGDYDNDGYLDIFIGGRELPSLETNVVLHSEPDPDDPNNRVFVNIHLTLPQGTTGASPSIWFDYNNDGYLDLALGRNDHNFSPPWYVIILRNVPDSVMPGQRNFVEVFRISANGELRAGDYNNDGYQDLIVGDFGVFRSDPDPSDPTERIFRRERGDPVLTTQMGWSYTKIWGDYDHDGDLDYLFTGYKDLQTVPNCKAAVFRNDLPLLLENIPPAAPMGLTATSLPGTDHAATLSWQKATDLQTPQNGLTYNIVIRDAALTQIGSPMADFNTGWRRIPAVGAEGHGVDVAGVPGALQWTVRGLPPGTYTWAVQTVDGGFAGSAFTDATGSFTIQ